MQCGFDTKILVCLSFKTKVLLLCCRRLAQFKLKDYCSLQSAQQHRVLKIQRLVETAWVILQMTIYFCVKLKGILISYHHCFVYRILILFSPESFEFSRARIHWNLFTWKGILYSLPLKFFFIKPKLTPFWLPTVSYKTKSLKQSWKYKMPNILTFKRKDYFDFSFIDIFTESILIFKWWK